ncbi:MAG: hypothetical protein JWM93_644 [Frankiales bacterium]|nr:hypothetical protein [Frankiales bacterium]
MRLRAPFVALTTAGVLASLSVAPVTAQASPEPTEQTIVLRLTPGDAASYQSLVDSHDLTGRGRAALLQRALPTDATRARVEATVRSQGLRVVGETEFTITVAAGARTAHGFLTATKGRGMTGSDGTLDAGPLAGLVTHIVDSASAKITARPLFTPSVMDGASVRGLYGAPVGPDTATTPLTIATVQFSGWDDSELGTYAGMLGVPDPRATGQYQAVSILGADPALPDGNNGNVEVALDQQALLATAPYVRQRAYFAPNDNGVGFLSALEQVASDAINLPELGLAALSISWGGCEYPGPDGADFYNAMDGAFQDLTAAGVTVFAASGDNGMHDCPDDPATAVDESAAIAVDFPASDPSVIAVGGTTADAALGQEIGWDGSGGGQSRLFPRPDYQWELGLPGNNRLLPDIAAVADPDSGFTIYSTGKLLQVGGTSLAAPLAAATLTTSLAARGLTTGVGDIHWNLYNAPAASFRDVTAGNNGFAAGAGFDMVTGRGAPLWNELMSSIDGAPTVTAPAYSRSRTVPVAVTLPQGMYINSWKTGTTTKPACTSSGAVYTTPTSVKAPRDGKLTVYVVGMPYEGHCLAASRVVTVDTVVPVSTTGAGKSGRTVRFTWRGTDATSGVASYLVQIRRYGVSTPFYSTSRTTATAKSFTGVKGRTYTLYVWATDKAGNRSVLVKRSITL